MECPKLKDIPAPPNRKLNSSGVQSHCIFTRSVDDARHETRAVDLGALVELECLRTGSERVEGVLGGRGRRRGDVDCDADGAVDPHRHGQPRHSRCRPHSRRGHETGGAQEN